MLTARNLTKDYGGKDAPALAGIDLHVAPGEFVTLTGRSGSGKTTLLHVLSTLAKPDGGTLEYQGRDLTALRERRLDELRHGDFAVIFQFHHLLPYLTAMENTLLPFMNRLGGVGSNERELARACLERVGLCGKEGRLPGALSGGEQQRVAIARALVKSARVLFADEPTGSLDRATGESVMDLLGELNAEGLTIVMVTHEETYAARGHRRLHMADGRIMADAC